MGEMQKLNSFSDVDAALARFVPEKSGDGYTLDTMRALMDYLGNPQDELKVVHIAGTSGKTSTAYFVAGLLMAAGYKTGLTISPHINEVSDRTQIDLQPMQPKEYFDALSTFLDLVAESGLNPSHFEMLVAFSYWEFHRQKVDYAVIEVGLGGLLDGTNVIHRPDKVCIITDIGYDHVEILGNTLGEIATQKAGIIQRYNHVFMYEQSVEVMKAVKERVRLQLATLHASKPSTNRVYEHLPTFQQRNFTLAQQVVEYILRLNMHATLTNEQIEIASHVHIPGRMEVVMYKGKAVVIDGAHNEQKIAALVGAMQRYLREKSVTLLVSFGDNKRASAAESLKLLRALGTSIIITRFSGGQDELRKGMEPSELVQYAEQAGFTSITVEENPLLALELLHTADSDTGLIVGSLYLLETVRPLLVQN